MKLDTVRWDENGKVTSSAASPAAVCRCIWPPLPLAFYDDTSVISIHLWVRDPRFPDSAYAPRQIMPYITDRFPRSSAIPLYLQSALCSPLVYWPTQFFRVPKILRYTLTFGFSFGTVYMIHTIDVIFMF